MSYANMYGVPQRPNDTRRVLPQEYELYDDQGKRIGTVELARTARVAGQGAETVFLHRIGAPIAARLNGR